MSQSTEDSAPDWKSLALTNLQDQAARLPRKEFNFFQVERLFRAVEWIDHHAESCADCQKARGEVEALTERLVELATGPNESRLELENRVEALFEHLEKAHGLVKMQYFTSLFSLYGLASSLFLAVLAWMISDDFELALALVGLGLVIGYVWGSFRDGAVRRSNLQY